VLKGRKQGGVDF
jgi:hypothetical protein